MALKEQMPSTEPVVNVSSALLRGYKFIRSGNVYITKNCRKLTQEAGQTVYVVQDAKKRPCGIRVPTHVWKTVQKLNAETRDRRRETVKKKDTALEDKVRAELLKRYPQIPQDRVQQIVRHMLIKRSGRVGRSKDISITDMVHLGVRAHVRHMFTNYDSLLKQGVERSEARRLVLDDVDRVSREWGPPRAAIKSIKEHKGTLIASKPSVKARTSKIQRPARRLSLRLELKRASKA